MKITVVVLAVFLATLPVMAARAAGTPSQSPHYLYKAYLSGTLNDFAQGIAVDSNGDAYVAGGTGSSDFPVTPGAFQSHLIGVQDAFVAKIDPAGKLIWSTYLGGSRATSANAIALDNRGDAYVVGWTTSVDFPTSVGAIQTSAREEACPGGLGAYACGHAFVTEFDSSGRLVYSTYLAGSQDDYATGVAVDAQGDAYVTGSTQSPDFPLKNPLQSKLHPGTPGLTCLLVGLPGTACPDAFLAKIAPGGTSLAYSTFLGGKGDDEAWGIAVDPAGNAYVTGSTESTNFPTVHAFQRQIGKCNHFSYGPPCDDAFVSKISADGSRLLYSTYLGGNGLDDGYGIAVDAKGAAYLTGSTTSTNFPQRHALQASHKKGRCSDYQGNCPDVFLTKLTSSGSKLAYSSHFGGNALDAGYAVAVDSAGRAFVGGEAGSYNFPVAHALQKHSHGGFDAAITAVTPNGSKAYLSSYFGGQGDDFAHGVAVGPDDSIYVAGEIGTENYLVQSPFRGQDAFVLRILLGKPKPLALR